MMSKKQQTMGFQTEVKKMLHLVVHSLYSNKEIFLRELISNASDALDKLRFLALSDGSLYEQDSDLKITVAFDAKQKTITITDNGIGIAKAMELNSEKQKFQSFAITITDERLQLLNKGKVNKIKLAIEELKDNSNQILGTQVVFTVPIKEM